MTGLTVESADSSKSYWGTAVTAMQSGVTVADGEISGTLKYLSSGSLVDVWGAGNFVALNFASIDSDAAFVEVGLVPTQGAGFQKLDEDHDGVFKIKDNNQKLVVRQYTADGLVLEQDFTFDFTLQDS